MTDTQLEGLTRAALEIVTHDRNSQYGEPEDSFAVIADLWTGYLTARQKQYEDGIMPPLTAEDVARMMELLKMGRRMTAKKPSADSYIDAMGYVLCEARMQDAE